jgi:hypothetical protein
MLFILDINISFKQIIGKGRPVGGGPIGGNKITKVYKAGVRVSGRQA